MQILQWLFRMPQVQNRESGFSSPTMLAAELEETEKSKDLVLVNTVDHCRRSASEKDEECKDSLTFFLAEDAGVACFYNTLSLKHLRSCYFYRPKEDLGEVRMGHKTETSHNVGSKVLPICDATNSTSTSEEGSQKRNSHKRRTVSRMKELIRWAAATKTDKVGNKGWKVLYCRDRGALKGSYDDEMSTSSSKMCFRWDVGSCSTSSSVYSSMSLAASSRSDRNCTKNSSNATFIVSSPEPARTSKDTYISTSKFDSCEKKGNWITTDSEFVVLEL